MADNFTDLFLFCRKKAQKFNFNHKFSLNRSWSFTRIHSGVITIRVLYLTDLPIVNHNQHGALANGANITFIGRKSSWNEYSDIIINVPFLPIPLSINKITTEYASPVMYGGRLWLKKKSSWHIHGAPGYMVGKFFDGGVIKGRVTIQWFFTFWLLTYTYNICKLWVNSK